jgi:hypothetical protein
MNRQKVHKTISLGNLPKLVHVTTAPTRRQALKEARPKVSRQFETTDIFARNRHKLAVYYRWERGVVATLQYTSRASWAMMLGSLKSSFKNDETWS